jgi:hypothetical protein
MSIRKLAAGEQAYDAATYVGTSGRLFYDEDTGVLRRSDGATPGGLPIPFTIATDTVVGGIKAGPGVVINSEGQILIDSTGLEFSFGDFQGTVGFYADSTAYALLSSVNADEDIVIASNGDGIVKVIGDFSVRTPNSSLNGALLTEPIFRVSGEGKVRMLVTEADATSGALEIVGNDSGTIHPPNQTGVIVHTTGNTGLPARMYLDANNNYPIFVGRRYNGTVGNLTQVLEDEIILRIVGQASTGTDFETFGPAKINFIATEDQGPNNQGGKITFDVTANGTNAFNNVITALEITPEGITTPVGFVGDGSQLTDLPPPTVLSTVSSIPVIINDQLEATTITNMTLTPPAGTYLATFSSEYAQEITSVTATAAADLAILYEALMALTPTVTDHASTYGLGETLGSGVYTQAAASSINGTLTLNGGPTDIFVFRCAGALTTANNATIVLTGGAVSNNVWWVAEGAISTDTDAVIRGNLLANQAAVSPGARTEIEGRLLAVNGAIATNRAVLTAPTGTSVLDQGSLALFNIFAGIGALTNSGTSTIALSIGTNDGTITGFETATITGETYVSGSPDLAVIAYGIYVNGVIVAHSRRSQTQTRAQSGWPMTTQAIITVTAGQIVDVRTKVTLSSFSIGPSMSLILLPVTV